MFVKFLNMKYRKIALVDMNYRYETLVFKERLYTELDLNFTVKLSCSNCSKGIYHNWIYDLGIYDLVVQIF